MARDRFELYQLRCFVAVAEELNFRRAAERLNMTQPPLSRQIKLLEDGIGLTLFERSNRSVRLTSAGESFFSSATDILQRAEHAILMARQAERGELGSVAFGFVPSAALDFMPRIVEAIEERLPGVTLTPIEMMSYEIIEEQRSGRLDLGLTRMERPNPEIQRVRAVSEPFIMAIPGTHPLSRAENPTISDMDGEPLVSYSAERGGFLRETQRALFASFGVAPRIVREVSQSHAVLALVNRGAGLALVPSSARVLQMENVVYREVDLPRQFRSDLFLVYGRSRPSVLKDRVRELVLEVLAPFNQ